MYAPTLALLAALATGALAQPTTELLYLSGRGAGSEVPWQFRLESGRGAGDWSTLPVPSHWEQHGFGAYNYGHDEDKVADVGFYRHDFTVPEAFCRDRRVELVFEGAMTDTVATLNGASAGPKHQGGFTLFAYDVTPLVRCGAANRLEVRVDEESADESVELAERDADYWAFGGIYRPVYLRSRPRESIDHLAFDARADGSLRIAARFVGLEGAAELALAVWPLGQAEDGGEPLRQPIAAGAASVELNALFQGARPWSAEDPQLYVARLELRRGDTLLHAEERRIGFRTLELRENGLFVNDRRTLLKGVNRHVFYPDTGRVSNAERDRRDIEILKSLNLNAVRMSHYPPDQVFLDLCDELGLYVLDELPGWHDAYDTEIGRRLVRELVERDAHHPSILFWDNGNEKGWNTALDGEFARHDLQERPVLHPQKLFSGIDTRHYPTYRELADLLEGRGWRNWLRRGSQPLVMPTEFLHALYEGGGGAGLADFWQLLRESPRALGGFLWAFTDESIARTDQGGKLDNDGNHAPDGVLGPWRELSSDALALREVFAPVELLAPLPSSQGLDPQWDGRISLRNRFDQLDLDTTTLVWEWLTEPFFDARPAAGGLPRERAPGAGPLLPSIPLESSANGSPGLGFGFAGLPPAPPGAAADLLLELPPGWREAWALRLRVLDAVGREVASQVLPVQPQRQAALQRVDPMMGGAPPTQQRAGTSLVFANAQGQGFEVDTRNGEVVALLADGRRIPWASARSTGNLEAEPAERSWWPVEERDRVGIDVVEQGPPALYRWRLAGNGWIRLSYQVEGRGQALPGILLPIDEGRFAEWRWLGRGPARVFRNREAGQLGAWTRRRADETPPTAGHEPKFAGYYGGVQYGRLTLADGFVVEIALEDPLYVGIGRPQFPADAEDAVAATLGQPGLAFLNAISAIGTKFDPAAAMGPASVDVEAAGTYRGAIWLRPSAEAPEPGDGR